MVQQLDVSADNTITAIYCVAVDIICHHYFGPKNILACIAVEIAITHYKNQMWAVTN